MSVHPRRPSVPALGVLVALVGLLVLGLAPAQPATARTDVRAPIGSDRFVPSRGYRGDFPDPAIVRARGRWYAYSTTIAALNLPVMTSTDLVHWRALGEGLRYAARWSAWRKIGTRRFAPTWAPTVAKFGRRWVHAYATPVRGVSPRKMCISVSRSWKPYRGFVDRTRRPLICPANRGAIDPEFFRAPDGRRYLLWKSEQRPGMPSQLMISRLGARGLGVFAPHRVLLTTQEPWEGPLVENPSMIRWRGRYHLFYSGGSYADETYAIGHAVCSTPLGPCTRSSTEPLLATGGRVSGPGGATAFIDTRGQLRLAYAAWDRGNYGYPATTACLTTAVGCPQRKLHVATLGPDPAGTGNPVVLNRG